MTQTFSQPGDSAPIAASATRLRIDIRWSAGAQTAFSDRIGVAALPLTRGRLTGRDSLVFDNQPMSPEGAVRLRAASGVIDVELEAVPHAIERIAVVAYVRPRPNAPRRTLDQLDSLTVSAEWGTSGNDSDVESRTKCVRSINLATRLESVAAATIVEILRDAPGWRAVIQAQGHESGLDGAVATAGLRL